MTATTVGSIGSALSGFDADREAWIAKNDEANRYAKANGLPGEDVDQLPAIADFF